MSKYRYDYYEVQVPGDAWQGVPPEEQRESICQAAITEAGERAKLYAMPCNWTARITKGEVGDYLVTVKVVRKRHR